MVILDIELEEHMKVLKNFVDRYKNEKNDCFISGYIMGLEKLLDILDVLKMFKEMDFRNFRIEKTQIQKLIENAKENANNHGWFIKWNKSVIDKKTLSIGDSLALIHSELSEALEAYRDNDIKNFSIEIADVFIRLFHLCGDLNINIENDINEKMEKNKSRPINHGRKNY